MTLITFILVWCSECKTVKKFVLTQSGDAWLDDEGHEKKAEEPEKER